MADVPIKATWSEERADGRSLSVTMLEPRPRQCNRSCPWRFENHGRIVKYQYDHEETSVGANQVSTYTTDRYVAWWHHLRTGLYGKWENLCHVASRGTNVRASVPVQVAHQCTGGLVCQQRELIRHVERGESKLRPEGAARVASAMLGREIGESDVAGLDVRELLERAHPALLDPAIGSPRLEPLSERELKDWA